jgi:hypothetical protein
MEEEFLNFTLLCKIKIFKDIPEFSMPSQSLDKANLNKFNRSVIAEKHQLMKK